MAQKNFNWWLIKIDRIAAGILFISILVYFFSGYGMTKGVIDRNLSLKLHQDILPLIAVVSFSIHTFLAIRLTLMSWRLWNKLSMLSLLSFYLTISIVIFYLELFYQPDRTKNRSSESSNQTQYSNTQKDITSDNKQLEKIFTREELANYNGKNGQPAYVAVDGIVYDLTQVFASGIHYSHFAGQELTDAFYSQHVKSQITKYPAVGRLKSALESRGR